MVSKLEKNNIYFREWSEAIQVSNADDQQFINEFQFAQTVKQKMVITMKSKINSLTKILREFQKTISQEKVTQTLIFEQLLPFKKSLASGFFPPLCLLGLQLMTDIHIAAKDHKAAAKTARTTFILADLFGDVNLMISSIETYANCQRDQRLYFECLQNYWKQLYLAWSAKDPVAELRAYDNLGLAFYYLNDPERAYFYHRKAIKGESDLEAGAAAHLMGDRYIEEKKRKMQILTTKNLFYRFSLMKEMVTDLDYLDKPGSMVFVEPLLTNFSIFDSSPIKALKKDASKKQKIVLKPTQLGNELKILREKQFKCNFTKDGLLSSLKRSNPVKYDLIQRGILQLDAQMLSEIDLKDGNRVNSNLLTHQSQNKSAEAFVSYHNFSAMEADICLEYITIDIKSKLKQKMEDMISLLSSIIHRL